MDIFSQSLVSNSMSCYEFRAFSSVRVKANEKVEDWDRGCSFASFPELSTGTISWRSIMIALRSIFFRNKCKLLSRGNCELILLFLGMLASCRKYSNNLPSVYRFTSTSKVASTAHLKSFLGCLTILPLTCGV